jgi:hypothetical protein
MEFNVIVRVCFFFVLVVAENDPPHLISKSVVVRSNARGEKFTFSYDDELSFTPKVSFDEARAVCDRVHGSLPTLIDLYDLYLYHDMMKLLKNDQIGIWLGIVSQKEGESFKNLDGSKVSFSVFQENERPPNNCNDPDARCCVQIEKNLNLNNIDGVQRVHCEKMGYVICNVTGREDFVDPNEARLESKMNDKIKIGAEILREEFHFYTYSVVTNFLKAALKDLEFKVLGLIEKNNTAIKEMMKEQVKEQMKQMPAALEVRIAALELKEQKAEDRFDFVWKVSAVSFSGLSLLSLFIMTVLIMKVRAAEIELRRTNHNNVIDLENVSRRTRPNDQTNF